MKQISFCAYAALCILSYLFPCSLSGQTEPFDERWRWVLFTTETGLPSNEIVEIVETSDGTPWVATSKGLAWYDDYQWHSVDSTIGLPGGIPDRMVSDLSGGLLVIYDGNLYQGNKEGFRRIPVSSAIYAVPFTRDSILVLTPEELLICSEGRTSKFEPSPHLDSKFPSGIYRTRLGSIWLRRREGYFAWEKSEWKLKLPKNPAIHTPVTLSENSQGNGLLAVENPSEVWEWSRGTPLSEEVHERWQFIKAADITSLDEVILVSASDELRIRRQGQWSSITPARSGIHDISCIASRENGDLWFGTKNGLYYFKRSLKRWTHGSYGPPYGRDLINDILRARDHSLWVATGDGIIIEPREGTRRVVDAVNSTPLHSVTALGEDAGGNIWIGSGASFSGAYRWDGSGWKYFRVSGDSNEIYVHKIRKDRRGRLWFLGINPSPDDAKQPGAYVLDNGRFVHWNRSDGLLNDRVFSFAEDSKGRYWFGSVGGVSRWNDGKWWYWKSPASVPGRVFTLTVDREDRAWFSDGITRLLTIGADDSVRVVASRNHAISGRIMDIAFDPGGTMWITTVNGMHSFDGANWSDFDYKTGLMSPMLWPLLCADNKIYVGTTGSGIATLDLAEASLPPPRVLIGHPRADADEALLRWRALAYWGKQSTEDIQVRFRLNDRPWSGWNTAREAIYRNLEPGSYTFEIEAKDLFGGVPKTAVTAGFTVPRPITSQPVFLVPTATLSIIAAGLIVAQVLRRRKHLRAIRESEAKFRRLTDSTFEGIVIHEQGMIVDTNASFVSMLGYQGEGMIGTSFLEFVAPAYRHMILPLIQRDQEGAFELQMLKRDGTPIDVEMISRLIPSETGATGVMAIRDITERKAAAQTLDAYQRQLRELASEVAATELRERQRMAAYLHDTIGQSLAFCKIKLGDVNEPIDRENLVEIRTIIEEAIKSAQSLTFELSPSNLAELTFKEAVESLVEEMELKHDIFIYFEDDKLDKPVGEQLRGFLYQSIRELIINAIKHGSAHSVEIYLRRMTDRLEVEVSDDGRGFGDNAQVIPSASGGFGLFNIRERLRHFGGTIDIASTAADGTRIVINVLIS